MRVDFGCKGILLKDPERLQLSGDHVISVKHFFIREFGVSDDEIFIFYSSE